MVRIVIATFAGRPQRVERRAPSSPRVPAASDPRTHGGIRAVHDQHIRRTLRDSEGSSGGVSWSSCSWGRSTRDLAPNICG